MAKKKETMALTIKAWPRLLHRQLRSRAALMGWTMERALQEAVKAWVKK